MARTPIARTAIPVAGLNLSDAALTVMATGAGNGVEIPYRAGDVLVLNNVTGGAAVFTFKTVQPTTYSVHSITVPDKSYTVATTKIWVVALDAIWKQADGDLYVDCDVAAKIGVLALS